MLEQLKRTDLAKLYQMLEIVKNLDPRHEVVVQKKKNYTWLIVIGILAILGCAGFVVYKIFFDAKDDFEDFDDEDFEDIDYDEDYDEDFDDLGDE